MTLIDSRNQIIQFLKDNNQRDGLLIEPGLMNDPANYNLKDEAGCIRVVYAGALQYEDVVTPRKRLENRQIHGTNEFWEHQRWIFNCGYRSINGLEDLTFHLDQFLTIIEFVRNNIINFRLIGYEPFAPLNLPPIIERKDKSGPGATLWGQYYFEALTRINIAIHNS